VLGARRVGISVAAAALVALAVATASATDVELTLSPDSAELEIEIETPAPESLVSDYGCGAFVAGRAFQEQAGFDIAIVLDTSGSTAEPSGADINRNGVIGTRRGVGQNWLPGTRSSDTGDTVLAAELAAAKRLVGDLDPRITRVAVISFSGGSEPGASAWKNFRGGRPASITHVPLTRDFARVTGALDALRLAGSDGGTHMAEGVRRGILELFGLRTARSKPEEPNSKKMMFFFTDGVPTEPYGQFEPRKNNLEVFAAARQAKQFGVVVHTFALGETAVSLPIAAVRLADMTGGQFTPVLNPGELSAVLTTLDFAEVEEVSIRSRPLGADATFVHLAPDGSFGGFIKLHEGLNRIEVTARASDGQTVTRTVDLHANHDEVTPRIPDALRGRIDRLRRECKRAVTTDRISTERALEKKVRKELKLEIERERVKARQRADEQRKSLDLEVEDDGDSP